MLFFFFFQAEDGIRDTSVTGVQTCALPIFQRESNMARFTANPERFDPYKNFKFRVRWDGRYVAGVSKVSALKRSTEVVEHRSEERRVGKECRARGARYDEKKKRQRDELCR